MQCEPEVTLLGKLCPTVNKKGAGEIDFTDVSNLVELKGCQG